jgi:hypothetical protein
MGYILLALLGFVCGGFAMWVALESQRRRLGEKREQQEFEARRLANDQTDISAREQKLYADLAALKSSREELDGRVVSHKNLQDENGLLKQDLRNVAVHLRKVQLDVEAQQQSHIELDEKVRDLGSRYLKENVKWVGNSLNPNNFALCKQRLLDVINRCRGIGFAISPDEEAGYVAELRADYEKVVRAAFEREEQARMKTQIREDQQRERESQSELERIDREQKVVQEAIARALAKAEGEHSAEVESLRARNAELEAGKRAISQAELTKRGTVYVISNIGSFGDGIFKIGMSRRIEFQERIQELSGASVPFPFDVHMKIRCDNAPTLETALHRRFFKHRVNRTNPRKEFFKTDIESIAQAVRENHGEVEYTADAEALQYRQSLTMTEEDQEFIEQVYDKFDDDPDHQVDAEPSAALTGE